VKRLFQIAWFLLLMVLIVGCIVIMGKNNTYTGAHDSQKSILPIQTKPIVDVVIGEEEKNNTDTIK